MKATVYYPLDAAAPLSEEVLLTDHDRKQALKNRTPAVIASANNLTWAYQESPLLQLRADCPKPTVRRGVLRLRSYYFTETKSHCWGTGIEISLSRTDPTDYEIKKLSVTGHPNILPDEERAQHFQLFRKALSAIFSHSDQIKDFLAPGMEIHGNDLRPICDSIEEGIFDVIQLRSEKKLNKAQALADRAEAIEALPDGTPLQFRRAGYTTIWQLMIKRGQPDRQKVNHMRVAPPELFRSEDVKKLNLSAHDVLPLFAAASKAVEIADASILDYGPPRHHPGRHKPDETQPLHPSFFETSDVKARRRQAPKIWMQTLTTHLRDHYTDPSNQTARLDAYSRLGGHPYFHPCFLKGDEPAEIPNTLWQKSVRGRSAAPIPDFGAPAGYYVISEAALAVLREHNTGATEFRPIRIVAEDGAAFGGNWWIIVMREAISSVMHERCDQSILANLDYRPVEPHEIHIDGQAHGDLDFWYDPSVKPNAFFFSDRLLKALKKAKSAPKLGLKPCEVH